jgi:pilus assembly protein CpaB
MNRVRILMVLVVALLAGGGLAAGTYSYLQNVPVKTVSVPTRPVVVARANLALGTELRAEDLVASPWPEGSIPEGAFSDVSQIVGRGLIASVVMHEPILPGKLASKEAGSGLPPIIPPGKRAVSVKVNEVIGVAGYVLPGTFVDVVTTQSPTMRPEDMTSKVVLTQVQVLAAGTRLEQEGKDGKPMQVTVVTLLVTPEQAERLALASNEGKIHLALRNPLDPSEPPTPGIKPGILVGNVRAPRVATRGTGSKIVPVPQPDLSTPPPTVEIIRGDKRERTVVG